MNLPKGFLTGEKAPYIVTLFIAALSWTAIRTADRLSGAPFIEYRVTPDHNEKGTPGVDVRLRNITKASRFECFRLTIAVRQQQTLRFGEASEQRHRIRGTVLSLLTAKRPKPNEWEVEATNLTPGADIAIFIPASGTGDPLVLVQPCVPRVDFVDGDTKKERGGNDEMKAASGGVPVLVEWGVTTSFVEHEIAILWSALFLWLILLLPSTRPCAAQQTKGGNHDDPDSTG